MAALGCSCLVIWISSEADALPDLHSLTITPCDGMLNEYSRYPIVSNASLRAHRPMARMVRAGTL